MPAGKLRDQLDNLRAQIEQNTPLSTEDRKHLSNLVQQIEAEIALEEATNNSSLSESVNLAVERFELEHPTLAGTLRNIALILGNIGI